MGVKSENPEETIQGPLLFIIIILEVCVDDLTCLIHYAHSDVPKIGAERIFHDDGRFLGALEVIEEFSRASSIKLNYDKTQKKLVGMILDMLSVRPI